MRKILLIIAILFGSLLTFGTSAKAAPARCAPKMTFRSNGTLVVKFTGGLMECINTGFTWSNPGIDMDWLDAHYVLTGYSYTNDVTTFKAKAK